MRLFGRRPIDRPDVGGDPFCAECGAPFRWYTDLAGFDTKTGQQKVCRKWRCSVNRRHYVDWDA